MSNSIVLPIGKDLVYKVLYDHVTIWCEGYNRVHGCEFLGGATVRSLYWMQGIVVSDCYFANRTAPALILFGAMGIKLSAVFSVIYGGHGHA